MSKSRNQYSKRYKRLCKEVQSIMCNSIGERNLREDDSVSLTKKRQKVDSSENSANDLLDNFNFENYLADANYDSDICSERSSSDDDELLQTLSTVNTKANFETELAGWLINSNRMVIN